MSSPETKTLAQSRWIAILALAAGLAVVTACTVRPLYGTGGVAADSSDTGLSLIEVAPVETRQALQVRNHLIFLLGGGAGQPANPAYRLQLGVSSVTTGAAKVQIANDNEPSAGTVTMTSAYILTDAGSGDIVASGKRIASASFDRFRQEYANLRAERDAEDRAARELAEMLRLALIHDMQRHAMNGG